MINWGIWVRDFCNWWGKKRRQPCWLASIFNEVRCKNLKTNFL